MCGAPKLQQRPLEVRLPRATERPPVRPRFDRFRRCLLAGEFGKAPKDLRIAIIHEDGAYGVDVSKGVAVLPLPPHRPMRNDDYISFQIPMCLAC